MAKDNRTLIQKADIAIADLTTSGGYLVDEQASAFIKTAIKQSNLLKEVTVIPMNGPKRLLESFRFGSRIMHVGTVGEALPEVKRSKPDLAKAELDTHLFKAEVRLPYEVLEDNLERDGLRQTVMQALPEAAGRDLEEIVLMSDTASADPDLAVFEGLFEQVLSNTVNVASAAISKTVLKNMLRAMPTEFKANKKELRLFVSTNTELGYRDLLAEKATDAGTKYHDQDAPVTYMGIPMVPLSMIAETTNLAKALLCHPKNINVGIQRKIQILTQDDIVAGEVIIVARMRIDAKFAYQAAAVKAYDIAV